MHRLFLLLQTFLSMLIWFLSSKLQTPALQSSSTHCQEEGFTTSRESSTLAKGSRNVDMKSRVSYELESLTSSGQMLRARISTLGLCKQTHLDLTTAGWFIRKNVSSPRTILRLLSAQRSMVQSSVVLSLFMTGFLLMQPECQHSVHSTR